MSDEVADYLHVSLIRSNHNTQNLFNLELRLDCLQDETTKVRILKSTLTKEGQAFANPWHPVFHGRFLDSHIFSL